jgi:tetratricopeptide (TPR) repeat protein
LIDARSDQHLWADSYERDLRDVLTLQSEVSRDIAAQVHSTVSRSEASRATVARPVNPEAHEAYLRGLYFWNKRTDEGFRKGIDYFEQATRLDPNYAVAYAGLAESYIVAAGHRFLPPNQSYPKAREAALKALQFDDSIAEAHTALASYFWEYKWDRFAAENEYRRAIEMNPNYATAPQWYSEELAALGRRDEASAEIKRAQQLDPLSLPIGVVAGWIFYVERDYNHAIEQYKRTIEMDPNFAVAHSYLGRVYAQSGDSAKAVLECQTASRLTGEHPFSLVWLGYAYAKAGNREGALHILRQLQSISRQKYVASHDVAAIYSALGESSKALDWLNKAYYEHSYTLLLLQVEPEFDILHSDARFKELVNRVGVQ